MEIMLGKQIGSGGTSNVFEWGTHEVIKIYKPHMSDAAINNEIYIGELLNKFSLDIPKYVRSIELDGKRAIIYERADGKVFAEPLFGGIYEIELSAKFAIMHHDIHEKTIDELPSQYKFLKNRILDLGNILGDKTTSLLDLLDSIPDDNKLCHGDFQPLNIIGDGNQYVVIDWNGACSGNPVFDVAWSYMTLNSPAVANILGEYISKIFTTFTKDYLSYYCNLSGIDKIQILNCIPIVATRRLHDNYSNENDTSRLERDWLHGLISNF